MALANRFGLATNIRRIGSSVATFVSAFHASLGDAGFFIAALALLAALLALSVQVSTVLFERKEM